AQLLTRVGIPTDGPDGSGASPPKKPAPAADCACAAVREAHRATLSAQSRRGDRFRRASPRRTEIAAPRTEPMAVPPTAAPIVVDPAQRWKNHRAPGPP